MLAETVLINVQEHAPEHSLGIAKVIASFTMHNLGTSAETMAVHFPISANDGYFNYPEITDLLVKVEGRPVPTRRITIPDPQDDNYPLPWAEFEVNFPSGEDVLIEVFLLLGLAQPSPEVREVMCGNLFFSRFLFVGNGQVFGYDLLSDLNADISIQHLLALICIHAHHGAAAA